MIPNKQTREQLKELMKLSESDFHQMESIIDKSPKLRLMSERKFFLEHNIPFENIDKDKLWEIILDKYMSNELKLF